jgi:MFS superfamily sulfate permease-like transporter
MSHLNLKPGASNLRYDLPAALVVFLVALPLCLGVAVASGVPAFSGIIAGAVGGIVIGLLSGSPLSVSGPAAGLTVIVLSAVNSLPSFEAFLLAVFISGVIQLLLGIIRAGVIGDFIPSAVIRGMSGCCRCIRRSRFLRYYCRCSRRYSHRLIERFSIKRKWPCGRVNSNRIIGS